MSAGWYSIVIYPDWGGPSCDTPSEWYNLYDQIKDNYLHTIYPHLFQNNLETVIQYWLFYPFNAFVNRHEGDWEHINVVLDSQNPSHANIIRVEYYFHHFVLNRYPINQFHLVDQTHPVIFVGGHGELTLWPTGTWYGEGSHGSYPIYGTWEKMGKGLFQPNEFVDGNGLYIKYSQFNLKIIPNPSAIDYSQHPEMSWLKANIPWGQLLISESAGTDYYYYYSALPVVNYFVLFADLVGQIPNDIGNIAPVGPAYSKGWNDVGPSPDGEVFSSYSETPPPMQSWSPPQ
jgi:hypothetical protein